MIFVDRHIIN